MLERLTRGSATVSELAAPLPISLPAVVQHLAVLEEAGIVRTEKRGRSRHCELNRPALARAEGWMRDRRIAAEERLDRLEAYLIGTDTEAAEPVQANSPERTDS